MNVLQRDRAKGRLQMEVRKSVEDAKFTGLPLSDIQDVLRVEGHSRVIANGVSFTLFGTSSSQKEPERGIGSILEEVRRIREWRNCVPANCEACYEHYRISGQLIDLIDEVLGGGDRE